MSKRTRTQIALAVILLLGLFLRLWRLDFGMELPYLAHTDEPTQYNPAVRIIKTGDLNPHFFNYPSLTIYLDALVMYIGFWIGRLMGVFESWADLQPIRTLHMSVGLVGAPAMLLLGRATTAVMGTLTLALVFGLPRPLTKRWWTPLFAAFLLAISMAHIQLSHYMTVDVIATFFAIATVMFCTLALGRYEGGALSSYRLQFLWLAALCGGFATSSKYNYAVLALPVGLTALLDLSASWWTRVKRGVLNGLIFCLAFVLTSPYVFLDYEAAFEAIQHEMRHYATGHLGVTGSSFVWYLQYLWEVNPFYVLLGIPGLALALFRRRDPTEDWPGRGVYRWLTGARVALPAVTFTVVYFGLIGRQVVHFDRNVLPVLVMLIVGVGIAVGQTVSLSFKVLAGWLMHERADLAKVGGILLIAGVVLVPIIPSWVDLPALLRPPALSGKAMAQAWFAQALETSYGQRYLGKARDPTLKIVAEPYTVYLDPSIYAVEYIKTVSEYESGRMYFMAEDYDIVVLGSGMFQRFYEDPETFAREVRIYDSFFEEVPYYLAFEGPYDPLAFRKNGTDVYVFFLTGRAAALMEEVESDPYSYPRDGG